MKEAVTCFALAIAMLVFLILVNGCSWWSETGSGRAKTAGKCMAACAADCAVRCAKEAIKPCPAK